uniref:EF-hand calcium binding domain 11 n=1 Tax=Anser cygnoides TaxID=8845 RepID=A0A8B9EE25_ANSCY
VKLIKARAWTTSKRAPPNEMNCPSVFEVCDEDNKGCLSREDFKVAGVLLFGYKPSKVYILFSFMRFISIFPGILFEKFLDLMSARKALIYIIFLMSNLNLKVRGFLTFEGFKKTFNSVSPKLSKRIVPEAFREVDQDSDGRISFKDFESAMKYGQDEGSPLYFA